MHSSNGMCQSWPGQHLCDDGRLFFLYSLIRLDAADWFLCIFWSATSYILFTCVVLGFMAAISWINISNPGSIQSKLFERLQGETEKTQGMLGRFFWPSICPSSVSTIFKNVFQTLFQIVTAAPQKFKIDILPVDDGTPRIVTNLGLQWLEYMENKVHAFLLLENPFSS